MLDSKLEESESPADDDSEEESESSMSEVRFIPEDRGLLDAMFHAMSVCQTLHPDPNDSVSDDGDFEDTEEGEYCLETAEAGEHENGGNEENEQMEIGQFEDADPEH